MRRFLNTALVLTLLFSAFAASAEVIPFNLEFGIRTLDVKGSEGMYRSQINERSGFLIRSFNLNTATENGLVDRFRIDVNDFGVGPAGAVRIDAGKSGAYRLRLGYRYTTAFSNVPTFANPFLASGVAESQHSYNRTRRMLDADLEFLPDGKFTPFVGYSLNRASGPGSTTYTLGGDDFRLASNGKDTDHEYRLGAAFNTGMLYGSVTQGWRRQRGTESFTLFPMAYGGNNTNPVLGRNITTEGITRTGRTDVDTPFTNAFVTFQAAKRIRVIGNYVRFTAETDANDAESGTGSFVSFPISRFFSGLSEEINSRAKNTTWRGGARAEITIVPGIDFLAGFQSEHRELQGSALINTVFLQTVNFGGLDPRNITDLINSDNSLDRDEDVMHAGISLRNLGPVAVRAEYREAKQDVTVTPDLSEIVVPGNQGGNFDRKVRTIDANANAGVKGFTFGVAYRKDDADNPILRTDYLDRDRIRGRASWKSPNNLFRAALTAEQTNLENDQPGINYDAKIRQYAADVELAPFKPLRLRGSMSRFRSDSTMPFRRPENFVVQTSEHRENGKAREAGFLLTLSRFGLDAGISRFENEGLIPFNIDRYRARVSFDVKAHTGFAAEWAKDEYKDNSVLSNYDATRYGFFIRYTP